MENENQKWLGNKLAEKCVKNLKKHAFDAHVADNIEKAASLVLDMVSAHETFGFGGSDTIRALGLPEKLKEKGKTIYDHWQDGLSFEETLEIRRQQMLCDCFFCSVNAIALTGEIVNVDGVGNRTNAMTFGPKKVVVIAGVNKIAKDLDAALKRVKETAAPMRTHSLSLETPCTKTGVCADCNDAMRICRITTILHRKPMLTNTSVILVNQNIGF